MYVPADLPGADRSKRLRNARSPAPSGDIAISVFEIHQEVVAHVRLLGNAPLSSRSSCCRLVGGVFGQSEPAGDARQHQALPNQGDDDDAQSDEENKIAIGAGAGRALWLTAPAKAAASGMMPCNQVKPFPEERISHRQGGSGSRRRSAGPSQRGSSAAG